MKIEEKISILSEALSKHLRFIRKMGGMYSLSAIEHADENGYVCEIAWNGLHQQTIRVSKKTKEEAYDDVARILSEIIAEESSVLRRFIEVKETQSDALDNVLIECIDIKEPDKA